MPREVIEECLRTAGSAPNGANLQPWHFVVVTDPAIKQQIRTAAELSGFAPSIIGILPLGPVELSASLGYYFYDLEITGDIDDPDIDTDDSGEDVFYGVGVGATFFERLHAKLAYEKIDLEKVDDSNAFWLTGQWRF